MKILDVFGLILVFVCVLYIGYRSTKKINSTEDFLLAGRKLGKIQAGFSVAASDFGGSSIVGAIAFCYTMGISGAWWDWCTVPAYIILGLFFAKKLQPLALNTGPEYLERRYDSKTRLLGSSLHIFMLIPMLGAQFAVSSTALTAIFGIPQEIGLLISVVIVLIYTVGGGLVAVVNTDVFQYVIIIASLIIAIPLGIMKVGGLQELIASAPTNYFDFDAIGWSTILSWMLLCFTLYTTNQMHLQRLFASKDESTAKFSYIFAGGSYIFLGCAVGIIALIITNLYPGLEDPNAGYSLFIKGVLPTGIMGIALGGLFAATMSTVDSMLLAVTTIFINDIYKPYIVNNKKEDEKRTLSTSRWFTIIICVSGVVISLFMQSIIDMIFVAGLFYATTIFIPLVLGIFWKRGTARGAFISIICALAVSIFSQFYLQVHYTDGILALPANILGIITSATVYVVVSLLTPKQSEENLELMDQKMA